MPSTPKGLPYPASTDPVSSGATNFQALANAVDARLPTLLAPANFPPASPFDGQLVRLLADDAKGIEWLLVYRAASAAAQKWEFLGGSPYHVITIADQTFGNVWGFVEPSWLPPRPGVYRVTAEAWNVRNGATVGNTPSLGPGLNTQAAPPVYSTVGAPLASGFTPIPAVTVDLTIDPAASVFVVFVHGGPAGVTVSQRALSVVPVRLS